MDPVTWAVVAGAVIGAVGGWLGGDKRDEMRKVLNQYLQASGGAIHELEQGVSPMLVGGSGNSALMNMLLRGITQNSAINQQLFMAAQPAGSQIPGGNVALRMASAGQANDAIYQGYGLSAEVSKMLSDAKMRQAEVAAGIGGARAALPSRGESVFKGAVGGAGAGATAFDMFSQTKTPEETPEAGVTKQKTTGPVGIFSSGGVPEGEYPGTVGKPTDFMTTQDLIAFFSNPNYFRY